MSFHSAYWLWYDTSWELLSLKNKTGSKSHIKKWFVLISKHFWQNLEQALFLNFVIFLWRQQMFFYTKLLLKWLSVIMSSVVVICKLILKMWVVKYQPLKLGKFNGSIPNKERIIGRDMDLNLNLFVQIVIFSNYLKNCHIKKFILKCVFTLKFI